MNADTPNARIVITAYVRDWAYFNPERLAWLVTCLERHHADDLGDLDDDDRDANHAARRHGTGRIMSVYPVPVELRRPTDGAWRSILWVITDDIDNPETYTTALWPTEY